MKERSGYVFVRRGSVWVRATLSDAASRDAHGRPKRREIVRRVRSATKAEVQLDAARLARKLGRDRDVKKKLEEILREAERRVSGEIVETFDQLADRFLRDHAKDAVFVDGEKAGGMRSADTVRRHVEMLRKHFAGRKLRRITYDDLRALKEKRRVTSTKQGKNRSKATVHRELSILRRMLSIAKTNGWIDDSPFKRGEALILNASEKKRERILTRAEETRLLFHCSHPARKHILPLVIAALDTGARRGELLKLKWRDVKFATGIITFLARNTKTERERSVKMSQRLREELTRLAAASGSHAEALVFGISASVRRAYNTAKRLADLQDVRFHDLRHTAATRLTRGNLPLAEVGRILGHTQPETTYRYVNADAQTTDRAAAIIDDFNTEGEPHAPEGRVN